LSSFLTAVGSWRRWLLSRRWIEFLFVFYPPSPCGYSLHLPPVGRKGDNRAGAIPLRGEF